MKRIKHRSSQNTGTYVLVKNNNIEQAIKVFKKKVKNADIMMELKKRQHYVKKSDQKREKKALANKRRQYKEIKEKNLH
jgi:small subunit ribosomal protein S21